MKLSKTVLAVLATGVISCALFSHQAHATAIQGNINFAGSVQFDTNSLLTATRVVSWINPHVEAGNSRDFAVILMNTPVTKAPWIFSPSTPTPGLWSVGGFTFDLLTSTVVFRSTTFLSISGTGIVSGAGFEPTAMDWVFSSQKSGTNTFSFSASGLAVPDGGSAVALLGLALTGIEVLRRKLKLG
jgi:VPDSG-CTERM motif